MRRIYVGSSFQICLLKVTESQNIIAGGMCGFIASSRQGKLEMKMIDGNIGMEVGNRHKMLLKGIPHCLTSPATSNLQRFPLLPSNVTKLWIHQRILHWQDSLMTQSPLNGSATKRTTSSTHESFHLTPKILISTSQ